MTGGGATYGGAEVVARIVTAAPICGRNTGLEECFSDYFGDGTAAEGGFLPPAFSSIL